MAAVIGVTVLVAGCAGPDSVAGAARSGGGRGSSPTQVVHPADRRGVVRLHGTALDGQPLDTGHLLGRVTVVVVWGSWCPPCVEEAPALARVERARRADDVAFVGVDVQDSPATAAAFQRRVHAEYPSFRFDGGRVVQQLGGLAPAPPTTLVLDRRGRVAARVLSSVGEQTLLDLVDDVLAEPA
ncbi:hypothetical protein GCM10028814_07610 [Angustibacter aerolatus]